MKELKSLRTQREKHFLKEDGSYEVKYFNEDIHYQKDKEYVEINQTIIEDINDFKNETNTFKISFQKNSPTCKIYKKDIYAQINWEKLNLENAKVENNICKYENENIELKYEVLNGRVKETIILKTKQDVKEGFKFSLNTNMMVKIEEHQIKLQKEEESYVLTSPFMIDQNENKNQNITYQLIKQDKNHYEFLLHLDNTWLSNATYPVIIDPTIINEKGENVYDVYLSSKLDANKPYGEYHLTTIGPSKDEVGRALLKFVLPKLKSGSSIIKATGHLSGLKELFIYDNQTPHAINVYEAKNTWDEKTATWNNQKDNFDYKEVLTYFYPNYSKLYEDIPKEPKITTFDLTKITKEWYSGKENKGIFLKYNQEEYDESIQNYIFYNKEYDLAYNTAYRPYMTISYRIQKGLLNYMDYKEVSHQNGTTYINTYNGHVVNVFETTKTISNKLACILTLIHNAGETENQFGFGKGWRSNYHETLEEETIDEKKFIKYTTSTGAIHYFMLNKDSNTYIDEDGLNLKIKLENNKYIMTDKEQNKKEFTKNNNIYYLTKITNTENNTIIITYNNGKITSLTDGSNGKINITYTNSQIQVQSDYDTSIITIEDSNLKKIKNKFGETTFEYKNHLMIKIKEPNNLSYGIYYLDSLKCQKIEEYGLNNEIGNSFTFEYGNDETKITDKDKKQLVCLYDVKGRLVNEYFTLNQNGKLEDMYGSYKGFLNGEENENLNNKLNHTTQFIKYVNNIQINGSFEEISSIGFGAEGFSFSNANVVEKEAKTGKKCLELKEGINRVYSDIYIPVKDTYTISFDLKSLQETTVTMKLYGENDKLKATKKVKINPSYKRVSITGAFDRMEFPSIEIEKNNNTLCYLDDVQIEKGEIPNTMNFVRNSNFQEGIRNWTFLRNGRTRDNVFVPLYEEIQINEEEKALYIRGDADGSVSLYQTIPIPGKKGDIYHVSFLYKAKGILEYDGNFGNIVNLQFNSNKESGGCTMNLPLNPNVDGWQYFCGSYVAETDYDNFNLNFISGREPNGFTIANVLVTKDLSQIYYTYDEEGNVIDIKDLTKQENKLSYDKNNQLISAFSPSGANYKYEYDNTVKTRLLKAISPTGIANEIEYDTFGNPKKTKIQNKNQGLKEKALYNIRLKGTKKYIHYDPEKKELTMKEDTCNHTAFELVKYNEYYRIKLQDTYLSTDNGFYFTKILNEHSLLRIDSLDNGSFFIKPKTSNKCLAYEKNTFQLKEEDFTQINFLPTDSCQFYFEKENPLFIEEKAVYTADGKFIKKRIDSLDKTTEYDIDSKTGLTKSIKDPKGKITEYLYNDKEQITKIKKGNQEVNYEYNERDMLSKIKCNNKEYSFTYDNFLNNKQVKINNNVLVTNEYGKNNGNLEKITYGNQKEVYYTYDKLNRLSKLRKESNTYQYQYNNLNLLASIKSNKENYHYAYDYANRIQHYEYQNENDSKTISYKYDNNSNVLEKNYNGKEQILYNYSEDDTLTNMGFDNYSYNIFYDELGRLEKKNINEEHPIYYEYLKNGNKTSTIVKKRMEKENTYEYIYDEYYNITHIYKNNHLEHKYTYNELNELIEDKDYKNYRTYTYNYDNSGNILEKVEYDLPKTILIKKDTYQYNNETWKDELTKFNDLYITYDEIGNPITIGPAFLAYQNGRELKQYKKEGLNVLYEYNKDGIRTKKTVNGKTTKYFTENSSIIFEEKENTMLYYIRDDLGNLIGFKKDNETYFYQKNIQEDITGIYNKNYELLATYNYDSWGNTLSIKNQNNEEITDKFHIAHLNPFRYRSYYYDEETNLYYLNSRYYNPEWGRFLNADGIIGTNETTAGYNLYAYCENNPINNIDSEGNLAIGLAAWGMVALGALAVGMILNTPQGKTVVKNGVQALSRSARHVINTKVDEATKVKDLIQPTEPHKGEWNVYTLKDEDEQVQYVGRTKDIEKRRNQHKRNDAKKHLELKEIEVNISYERARGVEQALIMKYKTLNHDKNNYTNNKINGIGFNNKFKLDYIAAAADYFGEETYVGGIKW